MKVVLVRPSYSSHIITPPLGLGYLSSYLKTKGVESVIIDGLRENLSIDELLQRILSEKPDAVGITCLTAFYKETIELCKLVKKNNIRCIIGGVHPTFLPHKTLVETGADYVVCGEGEYALSKLVENNFISNEIRGVYSKDNLVSGQTIQKAEPIENLDDIPFPDWGQISPNLYPRAPHGAIVKNFPIGIIISTRGCPYECTFCASPRFYDRKIRFRSPENVVKEIKHLVENFDIKEIHFEDDNLTIKRNHIEEICNLMIEQKIKVSWACPNGIRADRVDEELIELMIKSGCYYFAYGIESANPQILQNIKKRESIDTIRSAIEIADKKGISCQGFFIFGLPGENIHTMEESIEFARNSKLSRAQFSILDVLPGSELWDTLKGKFLPNWQKNSYKEPEWIPENLSKEQLLAAQLKAFRRFYFRPKIFFNLAKMVNFGQIKFLLKRLKDYRLLKKHNPAVDINNFFSKKNRTLILLLASLGLLIGLIYSTPNILGYYNLNKLNLDYNPLSLEAGAATHFYDEVLSYVPSVREVVEGHFLVRNTDAYEYMNGPITRHPLSALVLSPFFIIAGSVTNFVVLTDFVFPIVSFLLLFCLYSLLTKNKFLSICASVITAFSPKVFFTLPPLHLSSLKDLVKHFVPFKIDMWIQDISDLTKMEAIKPGLPFVLCFLIFLFLSLKKDSKIYIILSGIFLGSLFYTYAFHWLFFSISTVIFAIILLYNKQFKEFKKVFLLGLIGAIVSIPFWINYFYLSIMPNYEEFSSSIGKEAYRSIRFDLWPEYLLYISLATLIWFLYKKNNKILALFTISFLITNIVVYNLQVFIGFQFQSNHWATKVIWLNLALAWLLIFNKIFEFCKTKKWRNIFRIICIAIMAIFIFNAFVGKLIWASNKYKTWNIPQNQTESFKWLEENIESDFVVATPSLVTNRYIPLYTNNKIYVPFHENAPSSEILERLFTVYRIFDVSEKYFDDIFTATKYGLVPEDSPWAGINFYEKRGISYVYGFKYADKRLDSEFKAEKVKELSEGYNKYSGINLDFILNKYRIDYIYYGPNEKKIAPNSELGNRPFLEKVYNEGGIEIYKVK